MNKLRPGHWLCNTDHKVVRRFVERRERLEEDMAVRAHVQRPIFHVHVQFQVGEIARLFFAGGDRAAEDLGVGALFCFRARVRLLARFPVTGRVDLKDLARLLVLVLGVFVLLLHE